LTSLSCEDSQRSQTVTLPPRTMNKPRSLASAQGWCLDAQRPAAGVERPAAARGASWVARDLRLCTRLVQIA
jgi:hypothetical protein